MNSGERITLHRRMAESWYDGYRLFPERQELILSDEWRFTDEAVYWSPYFSGGRIHPVGKFFKTGLTFASGGSMETSVYAAKMPDWRPVEFICWPSENGFAMRSRYEGHTADGVRMTAHIVNLVLTNPDGLIDRYESHLDTHEFGPIAEVVLGVPGPFRDFGVYWKILAQRHKELGR
jgi:hypothetical protein